MNQFTNFKQDDLVWVEKYRPNKISECILPDRIKKPFLAFVEQGKFPNLLLSGGAGRGKTTIAKALCNELNYDILFINASDERNLDVVREKIKNFASVSSILGNKKAVILDESDSLNGLTQSALRAAIEEFKTVSFILTCNYKNKLIDPLKSRTTDVDFKVLDSEKTPLMVELSKRVFHILDTEKVEYEKAAVIEVVKKYFPDNRRILNELQRYASTGKIDSGILAIDYTSELSKLVTALKDKDLKYCREWIVSNSDLDPAQIFADIYQEFYKQLAPEYIPEFIIKLAMYQDYSSKVANQEINFMALFCELIMSAQWK